MAAESNIEAMRSRLFKQKREILKKKCKSLKISGEGSKSDIVSKIINKMYGQESLKEPKTKKNTKKRISLKLTKKKKKKKQYKDTIFSFIVCENKKCVHCKRLYLSLNGYIRQKVKPKQTPQDIIKLIIKYCHESQQDIFQLFQKMDNERKKWNVKRYKIYSGCGFSTDIMVNTYHSLLNETGIKEIISKYKRDKDDCKICVNCNGVTTDLNNGKEIEYIDYSIFSERIYYCFGCGVYRIDVEWDYRF